MEGEESALMGASHLDFGMPHLFISFDENYFSYLSRNDGLSLCVEDSDVHN
jgi:hypothetical protein